MIEHERPTPRHRAEPSRHLAIAFVATAEFHGRHRGVSDTTAECIDDAISRILEQPDSAWARQNQVGGELGSAWLVIIECGGEAWSIYWAWPNRVEPLQLLLLLPG